MKRKRRTGGKPLLESFPPDLFPLWVAATEGMRELRKVRHPVTKQVRYCEGPHPKGRIIRIYWDPLAELDRHEIALWLQKTLETEAWAVSVNEAKCKHRRMCIVDTRIFLNHRQALDNRPQTTKEIHVAAETRRDSAWKGDLFTRSVRPPHRRRGRAS